MPRRPASIQGPIQGPINSWKLRLQEALSCEPTLQVALAHQQHATDGCQKKHNLNPDAFDVETAQTGEPLS